MPSLAVIFAVETTVPYAVPIRVLGLNPNRYRLGYWGFGFDRIWVLGFVGFWVRLFCGIGLGFCP